MTSLPETSSEKINPSGHELSEAQLDLAQAAAEALSTEFGTSQENFVITRTDKFETPEDSEEPVLKEGDPEYDGKPWQEARSSQIARFALTYSGEKGLDYDPETKRSIMVKGWAFPVEAYPPNDPEGVPSVSIPIDL